MQCDDGVDFINQVLQELKCTQIQEKIENLPNCGLLGDWSYDIPMDNHNTSNTTPAIHFVGETKMLGKKNLYDIHSIVIPVTDQSLPENASMSADASLLQYMVYLPWIQFPFPFLDKF